MFEELYILYYIWMLLTIIHYLNNHSIRLYENCSFTEAIIVIFSEIFLIKLGKLQARLLIVPEDFTLQCNMCHRHEFYIVDLRSFWLILINALNVASLIHMYWFNLRLCIFKHCSRCAICFWLQICTIIYKDKYIMSVVRWIWEEDTQQRINTTQSGKCTVRDIRKRILLEWLTKSLRLNVIDDISSILSIRSIKRW